MNKINSHYLSRFNKNFEPITPFKTGTSKQILVSGLAAIGAYSLTAVWAHPATAIVLGIAAGALAVNSKVQNTAARILNRAFGKPKIVIAPQDSSKPATHEEPLINQKGRNINARIYWPNGNSYIGQIIDGNRTGFGTYRFHDGEKYVGEFKEGKFHGFGVYYLKNGDMYKGDFVDGKFQGFGTYRHYFGDTYAGQFIDDQRTGFGTLQYANGTTLRGNFERGCFISKSKDIGQSGSIGALLGLNYIDLDCGIPILSDYLLDSHPEIAKKLKIAAELMRYPDLIKHKASEIYKNLIDPANSEIHVLPFTTDNHAMLLAIKRRNDDYVFEIYNSGEGLPQFHDCRFEGEKIKFRTKLAIEVPKRFVSMNLIERLSTPQISIDEAYNQILKLPDAKKLTQHEHNWQTAQKGENCGFECIFAFLKNQLGAKSYHSMRKRLFENCIELAKNSNDPKSLEFIPELQRKMKKRKKILKSFA